MADSLVPSVSTAGPSIRTFLDLALVTVAGGNEPPRRVKQWPLGDGVLLLTDRGVLVTLDSTAHQVWRLDREGLRLPAIACHVAHELNTDLLEAEHICLQTLDRLEATGCRGLGQ